MSMLLTSHLVNGVNFSMKPSVSLQFGGYLSCAMVERRLCQSSFLKNSVM